MLIALNGFVLAFIAGVITFIGSTYFSGPDCIVVINSQILRGPSCSLEKITPAIIAINVLVVVLILWRFYSHYIDDDIVSGYQKVIRCEKELNVEETLTLLYTLEEKGGLKLNTLDSYKGKSFEKKIKIIENLSTCKKMGYRGHYWFNAVAIFTLTGLLISEAVLLNFSDIVDTSLVIIGILGLFLIITVFFCCGLRKLRFLSWENRKSVCKILLVLCVIVGLATTLALLLHSGFLKDVNWAVNLLVAKDIGIFLILAYLVCCYAHSNPTDNDIEKIINN